MNLSNLLIFPFAFQGLAMIVDEFYFHHKRRLPRWERWGHPMDSLTVLVPFLLMVFLPPTQTNLIFYGCLTLFSCLFVTKDEFVHTKNCEASENWLHAILFVLHPLIFLAGGVIWYFKIEELQILIVGQSLLVLVFLCYQIVYWNLYAKS